MPSGLTAIRRAPVSPEAKTLAVNPGGTASVAGTTGAGGGCSVGPASAATIATHFTSAIECLLNRGDEDALYRIMRALASRHRGSAASRTCAGTGRVANHRPLISRQGLQ